LQIEGLGQNRLPVLNFSERLRALQEKEGLSAYRISQAGGLTAPQLSGYLSGKRQNPTLKIIRRIAAGFKMEAWEFLRAIDAIAPRLHRIRNTPPRGVKIVDKDH
jgi:transcriptional regulator with XRE-family HTH domain